MALRLIIGADSAGYEAIAGPIVSAAIAFESTIKQPVLKRFAFEQRNNVPICDSKNADTRLLHRLSNLVIEKCITYEICTLQPGTIDNMGAQEAKYFTLRSVIQRLLERIAFEKPGLYTNYRVMVDANTNLGQCRFKYTTKEATVKKVWQIKAASLLAQDNHFNIMLELHALNSKYEWNKNKGYLSKNHIEALHTYGVSKYHRRSYPFIQDLLKSLIVKS